MQRSSAIMLLAMIVASLALPFQSPTPFQGEHAGESSVTGLPSSSAPSLESIVFSDPLDTSMDLPEYPLLSRALMLDGGSTDALLEDLDGDGVKDLAVAVSESNLLSVFFGQPDGTFLSWPSLNVTLDAPPVEVASVDRYGNGEPEILVVMSKSVPAGSDHFTVVNITSRTTYLIEPPRTLNDGVMNVAIDNFLGDGYLDVAILSAGTDPLTEDGIIQVYRGPSFINVYQIYAGHGAFSVVSGDIDSDGDADLAVSNAYDSTVEVFLSPYLPPVLSPNWTLTTDGEPQYLVSGYLNSDTRIDIAAACQEPSSLQFFYQGETGLPTTPSPVITLESSPSRVVAGDIDSDGKTDLLVLSEADCRVFGYIQGTSPVWASDPSLAFPSGAVPRGALVDDLTGDGVADIAVASARHDWSGSSIAVYPGDGTYSNGNLTIWVDQYPDASSMATGDLDGDGLDDLVLSYPAQNALGYMLGFSGDMNIVGIGYAADDMLVSDIDGDGLADVLTGNRTHAYVSVHFGNTTLPSGSMRPIQLPCHGNVTDVVTGDLDDDNLMDVVAATANGTVEVFFNTGADPLFSWPAVWNATSMQPVLSLAVGDFNSDGLCDVAYTRPERYVDIIFQKTSGPPVSLPVDVTLAATEGPLAQIWAGEVTGDYLTDIVALKSSGDKVFLFDQTSFDDMVEYDTVELPEPANHVSVVDVTGDECVDLLAMFPSADLMFMYKQSGASLPSSPSMTFVTGAAPVCAAFGDASGDGFSDLLTLDSQSRSVSVWRPIVLDVGPTAMFSLTIESPEEGAPFSFIDESVGYDPIIEWSWVLTRPDLTNETWDLDGDAMSLLAFVEGDGEYSMRLDVYEPDGDTDSHVVDFTVTEIPPEVVLTLSPTGGRYLEFETVTFLVDVSSYDPVVLYEWEFDASEEGFDPDIETEDGQANHSYVSVGLYTVKVRVTDSNDSSTVESVQLEVLDAELQGSPYDIVVTRDPAATYVITFNASALALANPEVVSATWEFGDGGELTVDGLPTEPVTHVYAPVRDYAVNLSLYDDDGNLLMLSKTLSMIEPTITLTSPENGSVVASGTPIRFSVGDDSPSPMTVQYYVNGGEPMDLEPFSSASTYAIPTDEWEDGWYEILVTAEDEDGNIAQKTLVVIYIDDTEPDVTILWESTTVHGGDRMNITVSIEDASGSIESVVLEIEFPGDESSSQLLMRSAGNGVYYAVVEVPKREGTLRFFVYAEDIAGNSASTDYFSVQVELRFMDAAWPYMLAVALLAALGIAAYFLREVSIAVDETFVIYSDGRMLAHSTRRLKPGMDDQVLSGMFVAVQDFIKDSFKDETSFRLRKLDFGEKSVLVEKGKYLFLAVVLHGKASKKVARRMKTVLDDIETAFSDHLADWDGDLDKMRGVNDRVKRLYSKAPAFPWATRTREV